MSSSELTGAELEAAGMREIDSAVATSRAAQDALDNNALQQAIRERRAAGDTAPLKLGVLISGSGTNLQAILESERRGENPNGKVTLVVASKPGVYALERAANFGVETAVVRRKDYATSEEFDTALLSVLKDHGIELVVLAGFLSVLGPSVIAAYPNRILNIHPSLIPSFCGPGYYGLKVHEEALKRGVKVTGATVHFVNEVCDGGPILLQKAVEVQPGDTPEVLQKRVMVEAEWKLLPQAIAMVCNGEA